MNWGNGVQSDKNELLLEDVWGTPEGYKKCVDEIDKLDNDTYRDIKLYFSREEFVLTSKPGSPWLL